MAERKYEAKERTVNKMTPGGLGEESLGLHDTKREGEVSTDAGILRHPQNANDWRRLYAESDADNTPESSQSASTNKQRQRQNRQVDRQEKHNSPEQETGSPEGGTFRNERSYEDNGTRRKALQRGRAERFRETEKAEYDRRSKPQQGDLSPEDSGDEGAEEAEEKLTSEHSARMEGMHDHSSAGLSTTLIS